MIDRPNWLPEAEWPFELRSTSLNGRELHYTDEGDGPTLLFVHAGMWSFVWREVIVRLRKDFRCVTLDFPGTGLSEARSGYHSGFASHSVMLEGLVDGLNLTDLTLIAHDLGAGVAFGWAARHPQLVKALVASNTFGWAPEPFGLRMMIGFMGSRPMRTFGVATNIVARATSGSFGVGKSLSKAGRRAFRGPYRDKRARAPFFDLMRDAQRSAAWMSDVEQALRSRLADRPLLTIFGQRNDQFGFQRRWKAMFPTARQIVVPRGLHFPMTDNPELFADSLRDWWTSDVGVTATRER